MRQPDKTVVFQSKSSRATYKRKVALAQLNFGESPPFIGSEFAERHRDDQAAQGQSSAAFDGINILRCHSVPRASAHQYVEFRIQSERHHRHFCPRVSLGQATDHRPAAADLWHRYPTERFA